MSLHPSLFCLIKIRYDIKYPKGLEVGDYEVVAELRGERFEIPTSSVTVEGRYIEVGYIFYLLFIVYYLIFNFNI